MMEIGDYRPYAPTDGWLARYLRSNGLNPASGAKALRVQYLNLVASERGCDPVGKREDLTQAAYRIGLQPKQGGGCDMASGMRWNQDREG